MSFIKMNCKIRKNHSLFSKFNSKNKEEVNKNFERLDSLGVVYRTSLQHRYMEDFVYSANDFSKSFTDVKLAITFLPYRCFNETDMLFLKELNYLNSKLNIESPIVLKKESIFLKPILKFNGFKSKDFDKLFVFADFISNENVLVDYVDLLLKNGFEKEIIFISYYCKLLEEKEIDHAILF